MPQTPHALILTCSILAVVIKHTDVGFYQDFIIANGGQWQFYHRKLPSFCISYRRFSQYWSNEIEQVFVLLQCFHLRRQFSGIDLLLHVDGFEALEYERQLFLSGKMRVF